ncbi:unnamed protein product [Rhizophagus irregularis]|nr:unnamed protein product [Rhizophagus irregularis]
MQDTENKNEWINWIEEAIHKEHIKYYEYKEFNNFQEIGTGGFEIIRELKNQREVDYHDNIIRCHGITKFESTVMEYANNGSLRSYLEKNFGKLTWDDKYIMAYQLACAVACLHNEGLSIRDLHSGNILVHQNTIKLADLDYQKRIGASSKCSIQNIEMIPYVDPKIFNRRRNNNNQTSQIYSLNEKSEQYDVGLALEILQGLRETVVPDTPENYVKFILVKCWDGEPDNRPNIYQVVDCLKEMITKTDAIANILQSLDKQEFSEASLSINGLGSQRELSKLIQNFNKMNTKEIDPMIVLNHILALYFVADCYLHGHGTTKNKKLAFKYYEKVANKNFARGQLEIGYCYENGIGINIDLKKAIYWYEKAANNGNMMAIHNLSIHYLNGNGVEKDHNKAFELSTQSAEGGHPAFELYQNAANLGEMTAQCNLGIMYEFGNGITIDIDKAIHWYRKASKQGHIKAQNRLEILQKL